MNSDLINRVALKIEIEKRLHIAMIDQNTKENK